MIVKASDRYVSNMTGNTGTLRAIVVLGFGAALINTMPMWIAEIAKSHAFSDTFAGLMGGVILLAAALSCGIGASGRVLGLARVAAVLVPLCLVVFAVPVAPAYTGLAVVASVCLGAAFGVLTAWALLEASVLGDLQRIISGAVSLGLMSALVIYLLIPLLGIRSLWALAVLSLSLVAAVGAEQAPVSHSPSGHGHPFLREFPVLQFPFFVMMGAYWTYLELFASSLEVSGDLSLWLLGSLLTGVCGSLLAGRIGTGSGKYLRDVALLCAAMSGAISYIAPTITVLGISVLVNGFFLFLYFPLYLSAHSTQRRDTDSERRMAIYLLGFALGGVAGAGILQIGGFAGLAVAIAMAGLVGLGQFANQSRS